MTTRLAKTICYTQVRLCSGRACRARACVLACNVAQPKIRAFAILLMNLTHAPHLCRPLPACPCPFADYSTNRFSFNWAWWSAYGYQRHIKSNEAEGDGMPLVNQVGICRSAPSIRLNRGSLFVSVTSSTEVFASLCPSRCSLTCICSHHGGMLSIETPIGDVHVTRSVSSV